MKKSIVFRSSIVLLSLLFLLNSMVAYGLEKETSDTPTSSWVEKIQPELYDMLTETDEKIPVWLWIKDIDHDEVEDQVYEKTGLTEANLQVVSEPLSEELAEDIAYLSEADSQKKAEVKAEFQAYMDRTEYSRNLEKQRVDTYISEKRCVQKEMYEENNSQILQKLNIPNEDIIAEDSFAPVYNVYLNSEDIIRLAKRSDVTALYYYDVDAEYVFCSDDLADEVGSSTVSRIHSEIGLTGEGVKVGVLEGDRVLPSSELPASRIHYASNPEYYFNPDDPEGTNKDAPPYVHSSYVARVIAGTNGVAPSAEIYSATSGGLPSLHRDLHQGMSDLLNEDVCLSSYSLSGSRNNVSYTAEEKYVDFVTRNNNFLLVKNTGNTHGQIGSPGLAYNVVTVGGFFNKGTETYADDIMFSNSSYDNLDGCLKPDLVSNQPYVDGATGTSFASPFAAGVVALLYELCPALQTQPEAVKAILMSSCHRKVAPSAGDPAESMADGITNHQGAGAIDPYMALAIAGSGNYGVRKMSSSSTQEDIQFTQPAYGSSGLNVTLTWLVNNPNESTQGPEINLDLTLLRNGSIIGISENDNSSAEMVYVQPSSTAKNYTIRVDRRSTANTEVRMAYAFSVDNSRYQYQSNQTKQGVYYLRNMATGKYLTLSNGNIVQSDFAGTNAQQWLLNNNKVSAVSTDSGKIAVGSPMNGSYKRAVINSTTGANITVSNWRSAGSDSYVEGSVQLYEGSAYDALGIYNNSNAAGASVAWYPEDGNDYQFWYLESIAYQKGDVNADGVISSADAQLVSRYISGSTTFSDLNKYLADVNGDNIINSSDVLVINKIVSGLI